MSSVSRPMLVAVLKRLGEQTQTTRRCYPEMSTILGKKSASDRGPARSILVTGLLVDLPAINVARSPLQTGPFQCTTGDAAVINIDRQPAPALRFFWLVMVGCTGLVLRIKRLKSCSSPSFRALAGIIAPANPFSSRRSLWLLSSPKARLDQFVPVNMYAIADSNFVTGCHS